MKFNVTKMQAIACIWLTAFVCQHPLHADEVDAPINTPKIRFCYQDTELFPAYLGNGNIVPAERPGVDIELYQIIAERAGAEINFERYSWNRCLALLSAGRIDSVISSYRVDRAAYADFPMKAGGLNRDQRITMSGYYLYHTKKSITLWDGEKLTDPSISIGAPLGYSIVADLRAMNAKVTEAGTTDSLLNLLRYNRFDAVAAPGNMTDAIIRSDFTRYSDIVRDPVPLKENDYFIIFSKKFTSQHSVLVKDIWAFSETVREQFREALLAKY